MPITKVTNLSSEYRPVTGGSHRTRTVSSTAVAWLNFSPASNTKYFAWTLEGGDIRITIDGSDPTASVGYVVANGSSGTWNVDFADAVRAIRSGATDGVFQIMECDVKGGY